MPNLNLTCKPIPRKQYKPFFSGSSIFKALCIAVFRLFYTNCYDYKRDGSIAYKYANFHVENINGNSGFNFNDYTGQQLVVRGLTDWAVANAPWGDIYSPAAGFVLLVCRTDNSIIQICFYEYGNQRIAYRTNIGGTWNAWKQY